MTLDYVALKHRALITLKGPDTLSLLERLVTHDTQNWQIGTTRYGGLLTPQGKVLSDWLAVRLADGILLDTAANASAALIKRLKLFRLRSKVEIEPEDDLISLAVLDPASDIAEKLAAQAVFAYSDPRYTTPQSRFALPISAIENAPTDLSRYHEGRVKAAICEQGFDFDGGDVFPADINMDLHAGVALKKGCFVGQEVVSRMHRRGKIRKRSVTLRMEDSEPLAIGAPVMATTSLGTVSSIAGNHALARLRIDRLATAIDAGLSIQVDEASVALAESDWLQTELARFAQT